MTLEIEQWLAPMLAALLECMDGGDTFTRVSDWRNAPQSPHADHHVLVSPPDYGGGSRALFNGNEFLFIP